VLNSPLAYVNPSGFDPKPAGTTGTNAGFMPLRAPTSEPWATSYNQEGDRSWREHPVLQIEGGFVGGLALGYVPGASPVMHLLEGLDLG